MATDRPQGFNELKNEKPPLIYYLHNASEGTVKLQHAPDGWEDAGYSYPRSPKYLGIFRKYAVSKLGFVLDGKALLEKIEREQGFEAEVSVIIEAWDATNLTYYVDFQGDLKLNTKEADELKYTVSVSDSSFENKVISREKSEVVMTKRSQDEVYKSLDGKIIAGYANEVQSVNLPGRVDFFNSTLVSDRGLDYQPNTDGDTIVPLLTPKDSEDPNIKSNTNSFKSVSGAFYINNTGADAQLEINGTVDFSVNILREFNNIDQIIATIYILDNSDNIVQQIDIPLDKTLTGTKKVSYFLLVLNLDTYSCTGSIDRSISVPDNHYVQLGLLQNGVFGLVENFGYSGEINKGVISDFTARTQDVFIPAVNIEAKLPHEAVSRILQMTTSENIPLYSDILGRKNSEPTAYTYDGELSRIAITNGALIRGFRQTKSATIDDVISPLSLSLDNVFNALNVVSPIGMGIEAINGVKTVRIEDYEYFFDKRVFMTIENASEVKRDYDDDKIFKGAEFGYKKSEKDEIRDGVYDYNNKSTFNNAITSSDKTLKRISDFSASNASINETRKITKEKEPTTDSKYDDITFMLDVVDNSAQNAILNGDAESGLADWGHTSGVNVESLIGSNRFVLDYTTTEQTSMSQNSQPISTAVLSFSYHVISSDELTVTPTAQVTAQLNNGEFKSLTASGYWIDGISDFALPSVKGVQRNSLQSMLKIEVLANFLDDVNEIRVSFDTDFLSNLSGVNQYVLDDIYLSNEVRLKARTTEGFDCVRGVVNTNDSYNYYLSPARCFERHGAFLRAPLEHKLNTNYVFSNAEKFSNLVSKLTSEEKEVAESTDFLISDLKEPLWSVERIEFDASLTDEQRRSINDVYADGKSKVLSLVKWWDDENSKYEYGWIDNFKSGGYNRKATFKLIPISKYVSVAEEGYMLDDDLGILTDDDTGRFVID